MECVPRPPTPRHVRPETSGGSNGQGRTRNPKALPPRLWASRSWINPQIVATLKAHQRSSAILARIALVSRSKDRQHPGAGGLQPRAYAPQQLPEAKVTGLDRGPEPGLFS